MAKDIDEKDTLETEETDTEETSEDTDTEAEEEVETETETDEVEEEAELTPEEARKLKETNKKLFARAMKAEGKVLVDGKWVKKTESTKKPTQTITKPKEGAVTRAEIRLINAGYDDESIDKIKGLAAFKGTSLEEAMKDEMFIAWDKQQKAKKKSKDASLGASNRSPLAGLKKSPKDMSREEHEEAVRAAFGK